MINKNILYENERENLDIIYNNIISKLNSFDFEINQINIHKTNLIGKLEFYSNQTSQSYYALNHFISVNFPNQIAYYEQIYNNSLFIKLETEMNLKLSDSQLININNQYYNLEESLYFIDFKYNIINVNKQIKDKFTKNNKRISKNKVLKIVNDNIQNIINKTFQISRENSEKIISNLIDKIIEFAMIKSENEIKKANDIKKFKEQRKQNKKERRICRKKFKMVLNELHLKINTEHFFEKKISESSESSSEYLQELSVSNKKLKEKESRKVYYLNNSEKDSTRKIKRKKKKKKKKNKVINDKNRIDILDDVLINEAIEENEKITKKILSMNKDVRLQRHTELIKKWLNLNRNNIVINQIDKTIKINLIIPKDFWEDFKYKGKKYKSIVPDNNLNRVFNIIQEDNYGMKSITILLGNDDNISRDELPSLTLVLPDYAKLSNNEILVKLSDKEFNRYKLYIKKVIKYNLIGIDQLNPKLISINQLERNVNNFIELIKITPEIERNKIDFITSKINVGIEKSRNFTKLIFQTRFFNQQILNQVNLNYITLFGEFKSKINDLKSGKYNDLDCRDILKKIDFKEIPLFNIRAKRNLDIIKHFELNLQVIKTISEDLEKQLNMYQVLYEFNNIQFIRTAINELIHHPLKLYSKNAQILSKVVFDRFFVNNVDSNNEVQQMKAIKLEIGIDTIIRELGNVIVKLQDKISDRRLTSNEKHKYNLENLSDPRFIQKYEILVKTMNYCIVRYKKHLDKESLVKSESENKILESKEIKSN